MNSVLQDTYQSSLCVPVPARLGRRSFWIIPFPSRCTIWTSRVTRLWSSAELGRNWCILNPYWLRPSLNYWLRQRLDRQLSVDLGSLDAEFHSEVLKAVVTECGLLGEEGKQLNKTKSRNLFIPRSNIRVKKKQYHTVPMPFWFCHQQLFLFLIIANAIYTMFGSLRCFDKRPFISSLRTFSFLSRQITNNNSQGILRLIKSRGWPLILR